MSRDIRRTRTGKPVKAMAACGLMCVWMIGAAMTARAEGGLDMHTDYPGLAARAGDNVTFSIEFDNSGSACDASLSIQSMPEGWEGYISGGGNRISRVHVPSGTDSATASLQLDIPADAADGSYQVVLEARANDAVYDTLTLNLDVDQLEVSLSAQAPEGWQVAFQPSGETTQVASIELESAASQGLEITVTPPNNVEAGQYTIPCSAVSAGETLDMELSVTVTESYSLDLSTPNGLLSFSTHANEESDVTLSITNNSNVAIQNVNLTSSAPTDWNVSFDTPTIDVIEAGATVEVTAHVTPSDQALTGDYVVTMTANASQVSDSAEFRVAVETSMVWGFVAVVVIVALLAGIGYVFRKYGRR